MYHVHRCNLLLKFWTIMTRSPLISISFQPTHQAHQYLDYIPISCYIPPVSLDEGRHLEASCWRSGTGVRGRASQAQVPGDGEHRPGALRPPARSSLTAGRLFVRRSSKRFSSPKGWSAETGGTKSGSRRKRGPHRTTRRTARRKAPQLR